MNKLNLPPFYIGQKVIYITGAFMPKDTICTIKQIEQKGCGCWCVDINVSVHTPTGYFRCHNHSNFRIKDNGMIWDANSFRPFQQTSFPLLTLSKIKETEKEEILTAN